MTPVPVPVPTNVTERTVQLEALLARHGVNNLDSLIEGLGEGFNLDACLAAVARYERDGKQSPGLLVFMVREAAKSPAVQHVPAPKREVTPRLLQAVRGSCNSPNGFTRDDARDMFAAAARSRGRTADELIDLAMGAEWQGTAPHPAFDLELPRADRVVAYARLVSRTDTERRLMEIEL